MRVPHCGDAAAPEEIIGPKHRSERLLQEKFADESAQAYFSQPIEEALRRFARRCAPS
jgi:hypothetical protein